MATELKRFTGAYATMTVAAYEPFILRWISLSGIWFISNAVAYRLPKAVAIKLDGTPARPHARGDTEGRGAKLPQRGGNRQGCLPEGFSIIDPARATGEKGPSVGKAGLQAWLVRREQQHPLRRLPDDMPEYIERDFRGAGGIPLNLA